MRTSTQLVAAGVLLCACVGPDAASTHAALVDGELDPPGPASSSAVALGVGKSTSIQQPNCSGVLIAPRLVLTAGHCMATWSEAIGTWIRTRDPGGATVLRDAEACHIHPNAIAPPPTSCSIGSIVPSQVNIANDLALLVLDEPITTVPVRSIAPPRSCLRGAGGPGADVVIRGYAAGTTWPGNWTNRERATETARVEDLPGGNAELWALDGHFPTEDGDSGGPYTEYRFDESGGPVLAVTSKSVGNPLLWSDANQSWLWSVLDPSGDCALGAPGPCQPLGFDAPLADADSDGLPDVRDLCPTVAPARVCNGQHCDADGDWVGDECDDFDGVDNTTGLPNGEGAACNHDDTDGDGIPGPLDICPSVPASEHTLADADGDGVPDACDRCPGFDDAAFDPEVDVDEDGVPDGCDNCAGVRNPGQQNCNLDVELLRAEPIQGDACDPDPCPRIDGSSWFPATGPIDYATSNAGLAGYALGLGPTVEGTMRTGHRWCPCAVAEEDSLEVRLECGDPFGGDCVQQASEYTDPFSAWRTMSHGFTGEEGHAAGGDTEWIFPYRPPPENDTSPGRDFEEDYVSGVWDFVTDASAAGVLDGFGSGPLSFQRTRAVVWSRAIQYEQPVPGAPGPDAFGCNVSMSCAAPDAELTSHYFSGRIDEVHGLVPSFYADVDTLIGAALLGPRTCPECARMFPMPVLTRACGFQGYLCVRLSAGTQALDRPVWEGVDPALLDAWENAPQLRWLAASEPAETLRRGAIRFAAYDPSTRRVGMLGVLTDAGLSALDGGERVLTGDRTGALELLSGNTATVLAVGGYAGQSPSTVLRRLDLVTGARDDLPTSIALGTMRAAAVDPSGRWLMALDNAPSGGRRLVRIDLWTGASTVIAVGDNPASDRNGLTAMPGGNWAVVGSASAWGQHAVVVFHVAPSGAVTELRSFWNWGTLATSHAAGSSRGVSYVLGGQLGWQPAGVENTEMQDALAVEDLF